VNAKSVKNKKFFFDYSEKIWHIFYAFSSWFVITILFTAQIPQKLILEAYIEDDKKNQPKEIRVLLENESVKNNAIKNEFVFLSTKEAQGQGKFTKEKNFQALSGQEKLSFAKIGNPENAEIEKETLKKKESDNENSVRISYRQQKDIHGFNGKLKTAEQEKTLIPSNYLFQDKFAFSFDNYGEPQLPTKDFSEFYDYFQNMFKKIKSNFAPPGGQPRPVYGDDYHSLNYVPGKVRYRTFPNQTISVVYALDKKGNVEEIVVWKSMGYDSLDKAFIDAIQKSKNFGPPPKKLLKNGILIMPVNFQFVTY